MCVYDNVIVIQAWNSIVNNNNVIVKEYYIESDDVYGMRGCGEAGHGSWHAVGGAVMEPGMAVGGDEEPVVKPGTGVEAPLDAVLGRWRERRAREKSERGRGQCRGLRRRRREDLWCGAVREKKSGWNAV